MFKMRKILPILLFLALPSAVYAQLQGQQLVDSLLEKLSFANEDTFKVKLLTKLSDAYKTINPDKGILYGKESLELAKSLGHSKRGIGAAYNVIGINYQHKSDYTRALDYYTKALQIFADYPTTGAYGALISHIGVLYQEMGNLDKALEYNLKALELDEKIGDSVNIGGDYGNIGIIYLLQKNYDKALEYDLKSMEIFTVLGDKDGIAHNLGNIGNLYKEMGNYSSALDYDIKALSLFRELGDNGGVALNLGNIGGVYLAMVRRMDSGLSGTHHLQPEGSRTQLLNKAISNLNESLEISRRIGQLDNIIEFAGGLHEAYVLAGNYKGALSAFREHVEYQDSVYSQENRMKIAQLETQREAMLKDKQIEIERLKVAQKRNERIILFAALALSILVIIIVVQKFREQLARNKQLAHEKNTHLQRIQEQKMLMGDIAHAHSHEVSAHVATILGLVAVFNDENFADPDNKVVLDGVAESARKLDEVVKDMILKENHVNQGRFRDSGT